VAKLASKGVPVFLVQEDAASRGLDPKEFVDGIESIPRAGVARLFGKYDEVWHW